MVEEEEGWERRLVTSSCVQRKDVFLHFISPPFLSLSLLPFFPLLLFILLSVARQGFQGLQEFLKRKRQFKVSAFSLLKVLTWNKPKIHIIQTEMSCYNVPEAQHFYFFFYLALFFQWVLLLSRQLLPLCPWSGFADSPSAGSWPPVRGRCTSASLHSSPAELQNLPSSRFEFTGSPAVGAQNFLLLYFIIVFISPNSLSIWQQIHMISTAKCTCHFLHALPRWPPSSERSRYFPELVSTSDSDNLLLWFSYRQTCFKFSHMNPEKCLDFMSEKITFKLGHIHTITFSFKTYYQQWERPNTLVWSFQFILV